jgi:hypothetical protein
MDYSKKTDRLKNGLCIKGNYSPLLGRSAQRFAAFEGRPEIWVEPQQRHFRIFLVLFRTATGQRTFATLGVTYTLHISSSKYF